MGNLIVLEGTDGSGKSTQFNLLKEEFEKDNVNFITLKFPRYDNESSALVRMYLGGKFGTDPDAVNPYAASTFYAVDRYASFVQDWKNFYNSGGLILADRYTTSNAVHQASKFKSNLDKNIFLDWLEDLEHNRMGIPRPGLVIYLDVPTGNTESMLRGREKATNTTADIHEMDTEYLARCRESGRYVAAHNGWHIINCAPNGIMRSIRDIHKEVYSIVCEYLSNKVLDFNSGLYDVRRYHDILNQKGFAFDGRV